MKPSQSLFICNAKFYFPILQQLPTGSFMPLKGKFGYSPFPGTCNYFNCFPNKRIGRNKGQETQNLKAVSELDWQDVNRR